MISGQDRHLDTLRNQAIAIELEALGENRDRGQKFSITIFDPRYIVFSVYVVPAGRTARIFAFARSEAPENGTLQIAERGSNSF